jgi:nitrogen-specific signal transduction histidine kinase
MGMRIGGPMKHKSVELPLTATRLGGKINLRRRSAPGAELGPAVLTAAMSCSTEPLLILDELDRICFANAAAGELLAKPAERLRQSAFQSHLRAHDRSGEAGTHALQQAQRGTQSLELSLLDGRHVRAALTPLGAGFGPPTHVCVTLHAPQTHPALEAVSRLAGELAHDLNNQLSAALNYIFVLQRRVGGEQVTQHLDELQATAWRAAALTAGLKLLGRRQSNAAEPLQLSQVVAGMEPLLRHLTRDCTLELELERSAALVQAPLGYLEQLIVLLVLYTLGRAPAGGTLRLRTFEVGATAIRLACELPEQTVSASVRTAASMSHPNATLRRALKRCNARLGHDARSIWVELEA